MNGRRTWQTGVVWFALVSGGCQGGGAGSPTSSASETSTTTGSTGTTGTTSTTGATNVTDGSTGATTMTPTTSDTSETSEGTTGSPACEEGIGPPQVIGRIVAEGQPDTGLASARVTLFTPDLAAFWEVRSDNAGDFVIPDVPAGIYRLGASRRGLEYREVELDVKSTCNMGDLQLGPETEPGSWEDLGDPGEPLGGTNSGVLLPDGRVMYCHDTKDPVILDPVTLERETPEGSPVIQGCHAVSLTRDGKVIYVGGADQEVYGPGTKQVKTFDPATNTWTTESDLNDYRWYPSMAPLPDGGFVVVGGGGLDNPIRVKTSEVMDPATMQWTPAGEIAIGNEVSPIVMLYTGEVLMTHRPPQLFDPMMGQWELAADFVQGDRMANGDHSDHELVLVPDGRIVAIGYKSFDPNNFGNMVEFYDPGSNTWELGANSLPIRSRASTLLLADGRILVMGGFLEDVNDPTPVNNWGQMSITDIYDPTEDAWRRLADLKYAREYHAMPVLVPDGRVFVTGGEGAPGMEPQFSVIEAFTPPYLLRGPRPEITALEKTTFTRGETFSLSFQYTAAPTSIILVGTNATTHFMDSGNNRYLELAFELQGDSAQVTIPTDPVQAMVGHYILFVMVDDIPSVGRVVKVSG